MKIIPAPRDLSGLLIYIEFALEDNDFERVNSFTKIEWDMCAQHSPEKVKAVQILILNKKMAACKNDEEFFAAMDEALAD